MKMEGYEVYRLPSYQKRHIKNIGKAVREIGPNRKDRARMLGLSVNRTRLIELGRYMGKDLLCVCEKIGYPLPGSLRKKLEAS